jgi:hypothetical protein
MFVRGFVSAARAFPIDLFSHRPQSKGLDRHPLVPMHSPRTEPLLAEAGQHQGVLITCPRLKGVGSLTRWI